MVGHAIALTDPTKFQQGYLFTVRPGYFDTMKTRVVEGRVFTDADNMPGVQFVVIDAQLAAQAFPNQSAVGKKLLARVATDQAQSFEVIGVVRHERHDSLATPGRESFFLTDGFFGYGRASRWALRVAGEPDALAGAARKSRRSIRGWVVVKSSR
jgi:hypothetical protein